MGEEFNNESVRDMCENFDTEVVTTPGYSPWSNGTCERHNLILTEILVKLKESHGYDWEVFQTILEQTPASTGGLIYTSLSMSCPWRKAVLISMEMSFIYSEPKLKLST